MAHNPLPRDYLAQPGRAHFIEWIVDDGHRAVAQFLQALPTACDQLLPFRDKRGIKVTFIEIPSKNTGTNRSSTINCAKDGLQRK